MHGCLVRLKPKGWSRLSQTYKFPLTQFLIDLQRADTATLKKMSIEKTAMRRGLPAKWVRFYRDAELSTR
jgi:hypothetical protein